MRSKILSVILSICMVLTLTPAMAFAAGDADATISISKVELNPAVTGVEVTTGEAITATSGPAIVFKGEITEPAEEGVQYTIKVQYSKDSAEATTASGIVVITADADKNLKATDKKDAGEGKVTFTDEENSAITFVSGVKIDDLKIAGSAEPDPTPDVPVVNTTGGSIDVSDTIPEELAESITNALESGGGITVADSPELSNEIAKASAEAVEKVEISAEDISEIDGFFVGETITGDDIEVVVQPAININVSAAEVKDGQTLSITYDLEYVYNVLLTKKGEKNLVTEGNDKNAIVKERNKELKVTVSVPVTLPLPAEFAASLVDGAWVNHDNKNVYPGEVDGTTKKLTFTAKHGFSPFTITAENPSVAQIGADDYYATLQAAVDAVENNGTIQELLQF